MRIRELEEQVTALHRKLDTSRIVAFERDVFSNDVLSKFYTGLEVDEYAQLKSFCEDVESRMVRSDGQPSTSKTANRKLTWDQELLVALVRLRGGLLLKMNSMTKIVIKRVIVSGKHSLQMLQVVEFVD